VQEFVFNAFVTLLVVVDPLGLAPIFAALMRGFSEKSKRESAIRGTLLGSGILFLSPSPATCCSKPGHRASGV
jgi:multiple antibiotic resistance protein